MIDYKEVREGKTSMIQEFIKAKKQLTPSDRVIDKLVKGNISLQIANYVDKISSVVVYSEGIKWTLMVGNINRLVSSRLTRSERGCSCDIPIPPSLEEKIRKMKRECLILRD